MKKEEEEREEEKEEKRKRIDTDLRRELRAMHLWVLISICLKCLQ